VEKELIREASADRVTSIGGRESEREKGSPPPLRSQIYRSTSSQLQWTLITAIREGISKFYYVSGNMQCEVQRLPKNYIPGVFIDPLRIHVLSNHIAYFSFFLS